MNKKGTKITKLPDGEDLGTIDDSEYLYQKIMTELNIPYRPHQPYQQQDYWTGRGPIRPKNCYE